MAVARKRKEKQSPLKNTRGGRVHPQNHVSKTTTSSKGSRSTDFKTDSSNDHDDNISSTDDGLMFSRWTPYAVWSTCAVWRIVYVIQPANWWIHHPDEIFQSFEVAHTQVYGYGFRPYEFSSLNQDGANVSMYRQRELELGMHSMRSALYPRFYVLVSILAAFLGADIKPFVLWKASHAFVSSLLPLTVHCFVSVYFRSHDAACLAAILVTLSAHLNVLGTHPLLNSFLAPGVFWSLANILPLLTGANSSVKKSVKCLDDVISASSCHTSDTNDSQGKSMEGRKDPNVLPHINGKTQKIKNGGAISESAISNGGHLNGNTPSNGGSVTNKHNQYGLALFNGKCVVENGKSGSSTNETKMVTTVTETSNCNSYLWLSATDFLSGFILSTATYIRVDIALFACLTLLPVCSPKRGQYRKFMVCGLGACAGLCVGIYDDFLLYGEVVVSAVNWAKFNVFQDLSGNFGKSSVYKYLTLLFAENPDFSVLAGICVITLLGLSYYVIRNLNSKNYDVCNNSNTGDDDNNNDIFDSQPYTVGDTNDRKRCIPGQTPEIFELRSTFTLLASCAVLLAFYSTKAHKELRFIHNIIVLMFAVFASTLSILATLARRKTGLEVARMVVVFCIFMFGTSQYAAFPSAKDQSNRNWAYQQHWDSHDVNVCLNYVAHQNDVTGVFVDRNFHVTGGYSLLHHDVPLFTLLVNEFVEFDTSSRTVLPQPSMLDRRVNVSFVTLDRLSNYVSVQNAAYLVKLLIQKTEYNYFVMGKDRRFLPFGFTEVFSLGTMRVMRRTFDAEQERQLQAMAATTPVGVNATVLRYEGDVLFRFQRFRLAAERYQAALRLDSTHAHLFQAMAACHQKLGERAAASQWISACVERFGTSECHTPITMSNINLGRGMK